MKASLVLAAICVSLAQAQQYIITTVAGSDLPATPVQAINAAFSNPISVAADAAGNVYIAANNCVFRVDLSGTLTRVAGRSRQPGYSGDGGLATSAQLNLPTTFANVLSADAAGNLYIADVGNNVVRKVSANGIITTVAGNGSAGFSGDNGSATSAQLSGPAAVAADAAGNVYIADSDNQRIRKVAPNGIITTFAGNGTAGSTGDNGQATAAALTHPHGVALDAAGNVYIADNSALIRKVGTDGIINTVAGNGSPGSSGDGGPATSARISPLDISADPAGNIYFAEGSKVRRVTTSGSISTVAGNGSFGNTSDEVPATSIAVCAARVTVDPAGNQFLADQCGARIRKVTIDGIIHAATATGLTPYSGDGAPAASAQLNAPRGIAVDNAGNIIIADTGNHRVRKIQPDGTIVTIAGTGVAGSTGDGGPATSATLNTPYSVLADAAGNLYIGTFGLVRKVAPNGIISTFAGTGVFGFSGDGPALSVKVGDVRGMALDAAGNLFLSETSINRIRKVAPNGLISTVAGTGVDGFSGDGGLATSAQVQAPWGIAVDASGNLYFADFLNQRVRKVSTGGIITTVAGTGAFGDAGDGGPATSAAVTPSGVSIDSAGNIFITETGFPHIRKVAANGIISTVAGTGADGFSGDGGPANNALLSALSAPKVDPTGNVYFVDTNTIRMLTPAGGNPILSISKTHNSNFQAGQIGATYTVNVTNNAAAGPTNGTVTVADLVPTGLTFQSMFGAGWNCIPSGCTRSDVLSAGASYPPITVSVNVAADAPPQVTNQVVVSGGHGKVSSAGDITTIPELPNPVLTSPANGSNNVGLTATLNWLAVAGAASYDVYFGTSPTPPLVTNTATLGYSPAGLLSNTVYYWRIAAKSGARSATSATFSFSTALVQIQISGNVGASGTVVTLSGSQSGTTTTDGAGNYHFSGLGAGGTYTVTPSLNGYGFNPQSQTFANLTVNQTANFAAVAFQCVANAGVPPTVRAEGFTEPLGDLVVNCIGGTPTPVGAVITQADLTVTLNTQITSRIAGGGEILLAIDEPTANQAILCVPGTANPGAPTAANSCPVMGTNGTVTEFKSGNSNVIRGTVSGNTVTFPGVPIDPPGASGSRLYRITNLRGNATSITTSVQTPGQITGLVQVAGLTISNPTQPLAIVLPSMSRTLRTPDNSAALTNPAAFQACATASGQRFATLEFLESFPVAFKTRTLSGSGITAQNTFGLAYNTETGYYNSALPVSLGLADFGTRLKAVFNNIPAGVSLYTSTGLVTFTNGVPQPGPTGSVLTVPQAALTSSETGAFSAVAATQTLDGIPAAALPIVNGSATAIWEVTGANSLTADAYDFPLWITFNGASTGTATVGQNYAPAPPAFSAGGGGVAQDASYPLPRFADSSSATPLVQITACTSTVQLTFNSVPSGQPVQLDGITLTTPQIVNWVQGSSHSIGAPSTVQGAGVRNNFSSWSDAGAQTHQIAVPSSATTYTLTYNTQYLLTLNASPAAGGSVEANPPSPGGDGYYDSGASVQVTATPTAPYNFTGFSGALNGTANPQQLIMNATASVTAGFFAKAAMATPAPGSVLTDIAATFTWSAIGAASSYSLDIGTAQGLGNLFSQNVGLLTSQSVSGLPANGGTIYVRLTTQIGGVSQFNDYTYTAVTIVPKAVLTNPTPGSTLPGANVTFNWSAAAGASSYSLDIGTTQGATNLFSQNAGLSTSQQVTGLPTDSSTIYVRLWTQSGSTLQFTDYTYIASPPVPKASMTSPIPGATLLGSFVTFTWSAAAGATSYALDIGTSQAGTNIFSQNVALLTSQSVSGVPTDGSTIYVRLWTQNGNVLQFNDYTYTAASPIPKATITSPSPGSTLPGSSATFNWNAAAGASSYSLDVGTSPGATNIFSQNAGLLTSQLVSGLPTNGSIVYVRLWTQTGSTLQFNDYTYTAATAVPKASITSPAPGSALPGSSATFSWNSAAGATSYSLDIGTAPGSANIFTLNTGLATSQLVSVLPTNGSIVYVRLWTQTGGTLQFNDYTYTAATIVAKAALTSPTPGSTLPGVSASFTWTAAAGASAYWLDVGTIQGQGNIFGNNVGLALSQAVSGIPTNGGTIYVRLWTQLNGVWSNNDYTFTAATLATKAVMTTPSPGATLVGPSVTFVWSAGSGASAYWLDVGTVQGQGNISAGNVGLSLSQTVNAIPTTGGAIYVRLWTQQSGVWVFNDYTYTAATLGTKATMVSPVPGTAFSGGSATFTWSAGAGASAYWLDVGTIQGQGNVFGNNVGLVTSKTVTGIPVNGGPIYVRLWTQQSGVWSFNDYTYMAANLGTKAVMLSPAPGSMLSGSTVTFTWSVGSGASAYWLDVGTVQGQGTVFGNNVGLVTSQAVSGIPASGGTIFVRLWTQQAGVWSFNDYTYTAATLGTKAVMLSPVPGATLGGPFVTFAWSAGAGASAYWLDVGTVQGQGNIFGTNVGLATSQAVTGIPTNGSPIYVRLWTQIAGAWQVNDYTYTAYH